MSTSNPRTTPEQLDGKEPFGTYLAGLADEDSPVGDLASDFVQDCRSSKISPSKYQTVEDVKSRLEWLDACDEALEALQEVMGRYFDDALEGSIPSVSALGANTHRQTLSKH